MPTEINTHTIDKLANSTHHFQSQNRFTYIEIYKNLEYNMKCHTPNLQGPFWRWGQLHKCSNSCYKSSVYLLHEPANIEHQQHSKWKKIFMPTLISLTQKVESPREFGSWNEQKIRHKNIECSKEIAWKSKMNALYTLHI